MPKDNQTVTKETKGPSEVIVESQKGIFEDVSTSKKRPLTMVPSIFTTQQLLRMLQKTPDKYRYKRPAKGGGQSDLS